MARNTLNERQAVEAARKILTTIWPGMPHVNQDQYYTPYFVALCLEIGSRAVEATARIKYFQVLWQASANPDRLLKLTTLKGLIDLLTDAAKEGILAIAKGEIGILARAGIQYQYGDQFKLYFIMGGGESNYPAWPN